MNHPTIEIYNAKSKEAQQLYRIFFKHKYLVYVYGFKDYHPNHTLPTLYIDQAYKVTTEKPEEILGCIYWIVKLEWSELLICKQFFDDLIQTEGYDLFFSFQRSLPPLDQVSKNYLYLYDLGYVTPSPPASKALLQRTETIKRKNSLEHEKLSKSV